MSAELQESYRAMQSGIASASHNTSQTIDYLLQQVCLLFSIGITLTRFGCCFQGSSQRQSTNSYKAATQTRISTLRQATRALLEGGTREDVPTGTTPPRKRGWEYEEDWERTKSRDEVLREWTVRQQLLEQQKRDDALRERQRELREQQHKKEQQPVNSEEPEVASEEAEIVALPRLSPVLAPEPVKAPPPVPTGAIRSSSRQSHSSLTSQPLSYGRPSTKIGAPKRAVSVKGVPLAEKGNLGTRNKRVR
jgi:kinesin family member 11